MLFTCILKKFAVMGCPEKKPIYRTRRGEKNRWNGKSEAIAV
jgi:hypothetical protein